MSTKVVGFLLIDFEEWERRMLWMSGTLISIIRIWGYREHIYMNKKIKYPHDTTIFNVVRLTSCLHL